MQGPIRNLWTQPQHRRQQVSQYNNKLPRLTPAHLTSHSLVTGLCWTLEDSKSYLHSLYLGMVVNPFLELKNFQAGGEIYQQKTECD